MNAYEIRHSILTQASDTLHQHWCDKTEHERITADREGRAPKLIPPPTFDEIKDYADKMLVFVQTKG